MFCSKCGKEIPEGVAFCPLCGASIAEPVQQPAPAPATAPATAPAAQNQGPIKRGPFYFPRNPAAIWSYYLGWSTPLVLILAWVLAMATSSPFPILLLLSPVAVGALVTGICGVVHAHRHPEGRGRGHSVFGIVMGSVALGLESLLLFTILLSL